jgi:hypothetical protein
MSSRRIMAAVLMCAMAAAACQRRAPATSRQQLAWSGWIEEAATQRGFVKPGDFAQFGCPPGWLAVEDTAAALRGKQVSTVYVGAEPIPHEGTLTCVAQAEFALPQTQVAKPGARPPLRQPLAPIWLEIGAEGTTIGFRSELRPSAPIYFAQETPCGPRVIGVRLGDLWKWLADPETAPKRDFLGMVSAGCPGGEKPR